MQPVAFYAINGVGLGHIARLGNVQKYLAQCSSELSMRAYCRSEYGPSFFDCPCTYVATRRELKQALSISGIRGQINVLTTRWFQPEKTTFLFDTFYPNSVVSRLRRAGHRLILLMESFKPEDMMRVLSRAVYQFDHIFFPCEFSELEYHYASHDSLWKLLQTEQCQCVGPFVRTFQGTDNSEKVIFTLGAGGDHKNESTESNARACLQAYVRAAEILQDTGHTQLYVAKGPLYSSDDDFGPLKVLETMNLPELFGTKTSVVTRGTYNLSWEAIAAGTTLVTTQRSAVSAELADGRNAYLQENGYAYQAELDGEAIASAVLRGRPSNLDEAVRMVNARDGLVHIAEAIGVKP